MLIGVDGKVYYLTTGTRATWGTANSDGVHEGAAPGNLTEISNVADVVMPIEKERSEITRRTHGGWKAYKGTLKDVEIELSMLHKPTAADYIAMQKAFLTGGTIALALLDGGKATTGSTGLWADFEVVAMNKGEEIAGAQTMNFTLVPGDSAVPPEWVEVTAGESGGSDSGSGSGSGS